jgi:hypothetical protein
MGYEAACTLRFDGRTTQGKAVLEQNELVVRGDRRVVIPIKTVTSAKAADGQLTLRFGRKTAVLQLGPDAEKWARRITHPPSRLEKLGARPGMSALIAGARHQDLVDELNSSGVGVSTAGAGNTFDLIFYGANAREALDHLADLRRKLKPAGALWIIRPKGSAAISESEVMFAGKRAGLVDVKVASFSSTHTAEKFVIPRADR